MIRHSFAEREVGSWLPTETAQTRSCSWRLNPDKAKCPIPPRAPAGRGNMSTLCALGCLAMAGFCRDAFPGGNPWQFFRSMHPRRGPGREKGPSNHARHANLAIRRRRSSLALATPAPPNSTSRPQQHTALMARQPSERATRRSAKPPERSQPRLRRTAPNRPQPLRRSATRKPTAWIGCTMLNGFARIARARRDRAELKMPTFWQKRTLKKKTEP